MTPQEIIEQRMKELWGERNIARLARESGVARESISKILGYKSGLGKKRARMLAVPLKLDPEILLQPRAEPVTLLTILQSLQGFRDEAELARHLSAESLDAIRQTLGRIEERLPPRAEPGQEAES